MSFFSHFFFPLLYKSFFDLARVFSQASSPHLLCDADSDSFFRLETLFTHFSLPPIVLTFFYCFHFPLFCLSSCTSSLFVSTLDSFLRSLRRYLFSQPLGNHRRGWRRCSRYETLVGLNSRDHFNQAICYCRKSSAQFFVQCSIFFF